MTQQRHLSAPLPKRTPVEDYKPAGYLTSIWRTVTKNLKLLEQPVLKVAIRALRDRSFKLYEKFKNNGRAETRASGIQGFELDEVSMGLTDIDEGMEEAQRTKNETNDKGKERGNNEKEKALDMRRKATATHSETKKRKEAEEESQQRSSLPFKRASILKEKCQKEMQN